MRYSCSCKECFPLLLLLLLLYFSLMFRTISLAAYCPLFTFYFIWFSCAQHAVSFVCILHFTLRINLCEYWKYLHTHHTSGSLVQVWRRGLIYYYYYYCYYTGMSAGLRSYDVFDVHMNFISYVTSCDSIILCEALDWRNNILNVVRTNQL